MKYKYNRDIKAIIRNLNVTTSEILFEKGNPWCTESIFGKCHP
jgi:hypothetical protein